MGSSRKAAKAQMNSVSGGKIVKFILKKNEIQFFY